MYMSITLDGVTYNSKIDKITDKEFETASKTLQENIGDLDCMHMKLKNGDILIIGKDAVQKAVIILHK